MCMNDGLQQPSVLGKYGDLNPVFLYYSGTSPFSVGGGGGALMSVTGAVYEDGGKTHQMAKTRNFPSK